MTVSEEWISQLQALVPDVSRDEIARDLAFTGDMEQTLNRLLDRDTHTEPAQQHRLHFDQVTLMSEGDDDVLPMVTFSKRVTSAPMSSSSERLSHCKPSSQHDVIDLLSSSDIEHDLKLKQSTSRAHCAPVSVPANRSRQSVVVLGSESPVIDLYSDEPVAHADFVAPSQQSYKAFTDDEDEDEFPRMIRSPARPGPNKPTSVAALAKPSRAETSMTADKQAKKRAKDEEKRLKQLKAEQERAAKAEQKRLAKEQSTRQKAMEQAMKRVNSTTIDKVRNVTSMTLELDHRISVDVQELIRVQLTQASAKVEIKKLSYPRVILWKQTMDRQWHPEERQFVPISTKLECQAPVVLHLMEAKSLAELMEVDRAERFFENFVATFPRYRVLVLIYGVAEYAHKYKIERARAFQQGKMVSSSKPDLDAIDRMILKLAVQCHPLKMMTLAKNDEISEWILNYTREVSSAPAM